MSRKNVGVGRLELPTSCSQSTRASQLCYTPIHGDQHYFYNSRQAARTLVTIKDSGAKIQN